MRLIGIDYGTKRVGIALSDPGSTFALPYKVIPRDVNLVAFLLELCKEKEVWHVILGESLNQEGVPNSVMKGIIELKRELEEKGLTVSLESEGFTSFEAERYQGKHEYTDASAAALILQRYLDKNNTL